MARSRPPSRESSPLWRSADEETPLLDGEGEDGREEPEGPSPEALAQCEVYPLIWSIRRDVIRNIETPFTWEQLQSPHLTYNVVQQLALKYGALYQRNWAVVFAFLVNRVQFISESSAPTQLGVNATRAALCELLALKVLRVYADKGSRIELAYVLAGHFRLFQGAQPEVLEQVRQEEGDTLTKSANALEMAIVGNAKRFIKSPHCQRIINAIWDGSIVYTASSTHAFLRDEYKRKPITFYDPRRAPLLDHYRLKVPRIRSALEYCNFVILFLLFVVAIESKEEHSMNPIEFIFVLYALGFTLDKLASTQEHGWRVYSANLWNGFDLIFIVDFLAYLAFRLYGIHSDRPWASHLGMEILACAAALLFPRLAFVTLSNNLLILSIRAMFLDFVFLMALGAFCFAGFLYALWTLGRGQYTAGQLAEYMVFIWFGLDGTGLAISPKLHPIFGPALVVLYACLSNTLLLTILVSILSTTFAKIDADAEGEYMFRQAVQTLEGVKSDALFGYQPPLNILAVIIMTPARWILTPRWFHKINVFMVRFTSAPILLLISIYERYEPATARSFLPFWYSLRLAADKFGDSLPRKFRTLTLLEGLVGSSKDIALAFEIHPEQDVRYSDYSDESDEETDEGGRRSDADDGGAAPDRFMLESDMHKRMMEQIERRLHRGPSTTVTSLETDAALVQQAARGAAFEHGDRMRRSRAEQGQQSQQQDQQQPEQGQQQQQQDQQQQPQQQPDQPPTAHQKPEAAAAPPQGEQFIQAESGAITFNMPFPTRERGQQSPPAPGPSRAEPPEREPKRQSRGVPLRRSRTFDDPSPGASRRQGSSTSVADGNGAERGIAGIGRAPRLRRMSNLDSTLSRSIGSLDSPLARAFTISNQHRHPPSHPPRRFQSHREGGAHPRGSGGSGGHGAEPSQSNSALADEEVSEPEEARNVRFEQTRSPEQISRGGSRGQQGRQAMHVQGQADAIARVENELRGKLDAIEERQKRMEDILTGLAATITAPPPPPEEAGPPVDIYNG